MSAAAITRSRPCPPADHRGSTQRAVLWVSARTLAQIAGECAHRRLALEAGPPVSAEALLERQRDVERLLRLERGLTAALEQRTRLRLRLTAEPTTSENVIDGEEVARP